MFFILDADVLIDYVGADLGLLGAVSRSVGPVHVAAAVLAEVDGLDATAFETLGLVVVEASIESLQHAGSARGRLSFEDHLCLQIALERRWTCITNDRALRNACKAEGVALRWGLQVMLDLLRVDPSQLDRAIAAATAIHEKNRTHVTRAILDEFTRHARELAESKSKA